MPVVCVLVVCVPVFEWLLFVCLCGYVLVVCVLVVFVSVVCVLCLWLFVCLCVCVLFGCGF